MYRIKITNLKTQSEHIFYAVRPPSNQCAGLIEAVEDSTPIRDLPHNSTQYCVIISTL